MNNVLMEQKFKKQNLISEKAHVLKNLVMKISILMNALHLAVLIKIFNEY